jgi:hypothetical protein
MEGERRVERGRFCYVTCPTKKPIVIFEGTFREEMRDFLRQLARDNQIYNAWDPVEKRWIFPVKFKEKITEKAKLLFDTVYYGTDGAYETIKSMYS